MNAVYYIKILIISMTIVNIYSINDLYDRRIVNATVVRGNRFARQYRCPTLNLLLCPNAVQHVNSGVYAVQIAITRSASKPWDRLHNPRVDYTVKCVGMAYIDARRVGDRSDFVLSNGVEHIQLVEIYVFGVGYERDFYDDRVSVLFVSKKIVEHQDNLEISKLQEHLEFCKHQTILQLHNMGLVRIVNLKQSVTCE